LFMAFFSSMFLFAMMLVIVLPSCMLIDIMLVLLQLHSSTIISIICVSTHGIVSFPLCCYYFPLALLCKRRLLVIFTLLLVLFLLLPTSTFHFEVRFFFFFFLVICVLVYVSLIIIILFSYLYLYLYFCFVCSNYYFLTFFLGLVLYACFNIFLVCLYVVQKQEL
jgi:hypothetical protein